MATYSIPVTFDGEIPEFAFKENFTDQDNAFLPLEHDAVISQLSEDARQLGRESEYFTYIPVSPLRRLHNPYLRGQLLPSC